MRVPDRLLAIAAAVVISASSLLASAQEGSAGFDDLRAPASPAFVLLGAAPSEIQRPSTPRAVGLSLGTAVREADDLLPSNYAIEIAPYWLESRPDLTFEDYVRTDVGNALANLYRNVALSFGTETNTEGGASETLATFGLRTSARFGGDLTEARAAYRRQAEKLAEMAAARSARGQLSRIETVIARERARMLVLQGELVELRDGVDDLSAAYEQRAAQVEPEIAELSARITAASAAGDTTEVARLQAEKERKQAGLDGLAARAAEEGALEERIGGVEGRIEELETRADEYRTAIATYDDLEAEERQLALELESHIERLGGLLVEVAGAVAFVFPEGAYDEGKLDRWSAWLTASYRLRGDVELDALGLLRYQAFENDRLDPEFVDLGLRGIALVGDLSVYVEYIKRLNTGGAESRNTTRTVVGIEYEIEDGLYLTGSFGRDFALREASDQEPLLAILGLAFQLGPPQRFEVPTGSAAEDQPDG